MKNIFYLLLIVVSISFQSCTNSLKRYELDLLICEPPLDNKLNEQQIQIILPIKKSKKEIYLAQGNVFNTKGKVSYERKKNLLDKIRGGMTKNTSFMILNEKIKNHLNKLNLTSIFLDKPLTFDEITKSLTNYDVILGYSPSGTINSSTYSFKFFTNNVYLSSYITDSILVNNPGAKIVVVCNPPITKGPIPPEGPTAQPCNSLPEAEPLRQELLKIIDTKRSRQEREKIAAQVWDEYFYPNVYIQNFEDINSNHPQIWDAGHGKSYFAHLVTLPSIIDICILEIERDKETNKISGLKVHETRNKSLITN
jgi:hypothetical protein